MPTLDVPLPDPALLQYTIETRPGATQQWLERLPFASPVEAAQQLVLALYSLNRIALDEDRRIELLALYGPAVNRAAASLEGLLLEAGVPPAPQQRQAGTLLRELQIEYSIGWKHVLRALSSRRSARSQIRHIAGATAHLLTALHDVQFGCHLSYSPLPEHFWLEFHDVYRLARNNGLSGKSIHDAPPADFACTQALLLELADPPHMSRAELAHIKLYLRRFGKLATLGAAAPGRTHGFAVDTHADRGAGGPAVAAEHALWLDTEAICRHIHEVGVRLRTGETPARIGLPPGMRSEASLTLSRHLTKAWRPGNHRAYRRYAAPEQAVEVVAGVGAIHRLLERRQPDRATAKTDDGPRAAGGAPDMPASTWSLCNDSAAGLALHGTPDLPLNLKVGDALALRGKTSAAWSLGAIRWIKMLDARRVELGIERLAPTIEPARVRPLKGRRQASAEPALLLPGSPALRQPARLVLSSHVYHKGMRAEVWQDGHATTITLEHRAERTPSFDLIGFTVIDPAP